MSVCPRLLTKRTLRCAGVMLRVAIGLFPVIGCAQPAAILAGAGEVAHAGAGQESSDRIWQPISESSLPAAVRRTNVTGRYAIVRLNKAALDDRLKGAPLENTPAAAGAQVVITLPLPDGRFARFRVEESPTLAPELAAAFPQIKTYRGVGLDDPTASTRFGWTDAGFHAIILASGGSSYIDPYAPPDLSIYLCYREGDLRNDRKDGAR